MVFKTDKYIVGEYEGKVLIFYNDDKFSNYGLVDPEICYHD